MSVNDRSKACVSTQKRRLVPVSTGMLACGAGVLLFCQSFACSSDRQRGGEKMVVNTTDLCKDVSGFAGPVPVNIYITGGVIDSIRPLPNGETPRFFMRVEQSGLLKSYEGKTLQQAAKMTPDAVSGATYSSTAIITNIKKGVDKAIADSK